MSILLPVASGKGGVGKTVVAANLGVALARLGKTVILIDLDLGGSNLHTCFGIPNKNPGVGAFITHKTETLESLIVETEQERLSLIPGDSLLPGAANIPFFVKRKILKQLESLIADYVILDLGSGSAFNTVDFFLTSSRGLIVTTPETTSILNAYSFLKTALYRLILLSFPQKSTERQIITSFVSEKIEGSDLSFENLRDRLSEHDPLSGRAADLCMKTFIPRIVLNRGRTARDLALGHKLREIVSRNMKTSIEYIGFLPVDESVERSIFERKPAILSSDSPFALNITNTARKIAETPVGESPRLFEADEDMEELNRNLVL